jgi:hypothetical protein
MTAQRVRTWTAEEVHALGVRTDVPTAGEILAGLCRDEAYRMVQRGEFPVPVIRVGKNRLVVPVAPILRLLGIAAPDVEGGIEPVPQIGAATAQPEPATGPILHVRTTNESSDSRTAPRPGRRPHNSNIGHHHDNPKQRDAG